MYIRVYYLARQLCRQNILDAGRKSGPTINEALRFRKLKKICRRFSLKSPGIEKWLLVCKVLCGNVLEPRAPEEFSENCIADYICKKIYQK
ncbi:MAG: hypothetical protein K2X27_24635 [Candidatus Obscuribacterales bacterium]|nr:hypothetical protein [Candidatus Obscuribacterales bacterium]